MTEADNQRPTSPDPVRVGLIVEADQAPRFVAAIQDCSAMELCALAGMPQSAVPADVPWFDDTRVLIAQGDIDALVIATSPRAGVNMGNVAVTHGVHVWRRPPLGRNFAEAIELARPLQTVEVVYRVASWWEHVAEQIGWALDRETVGELSYSEVRVSAAGPPLQSWRSSQVDAGGGVLVSDGYGLLEALTAIRGLPESVSAATGKCRRRPSEAPRETEDIANAILRYEGGGVALVRATWDILPSEQSTLHHSSESSLRYTKSSVAVLAATGEVLEQRPLPAGTLPAEMKRFAAEINGTVQREPARQAIDRHVAVSALLETTYLSSRTEHPESPRRLFEVQKWPEPKR